MEGTAQWTAEQNIWRQCNASPCVSDIHDFEEEFRGYWVLYFHNIIILHVGFNSLSVLCKEFFLLLLWCTIWLVLIPSFFACFCHPLGCWHLKHIHTENVGKNCVAAHNVAFCQWCGCYVLSTCLRVKFSIRGQKEIPSSCFLPPSNIFWEKAMISITLAFFQRNTVVAVFGL